MIKQILTALCLICATDSALSAERGYLGVWFVPLPASGNVRTGVIVKKVFRGMAGERAGLKPGEIVTKINGVPAPDPKTAVNLLAENRAGDRIWLTVIDGTDGKNRQSTVFATMGSKPTSDFAKIMRAKPLRPQWRLPSSPDLHCVGKTTAWDGSCRQDTGAKH